ncbi:kynurenine aminotransferase isoform X2 [Rhipicephalus sanguineus]|uniref:kynurenine aminotransferase isoform X2 n=1 Tax=Rhipicephalus sanguineus TaxID=34632 RepID=UPI0018955202|nr:kynurenine aminotransferase isoform X2 [Rhipicephalus sanguineus]
MSINEKAEREEPEDNDAWVKCLSPGEEGDVVDLSLGFPDCPPPDFLQDALQAAISCKALHQYTRGSGHPRLANALSQMYSRLIGRNIDPEEEVLVTVGATEALYTTFFGLVNPGEEVILIEPCFPLYGPQVLLAGGVPVFVPLRPCKQGVISSADWILDPKELASKFNFRTKMILVNNPHNPLGKVFSQEELELIAELCRQHNVICVMDEVYEWIRYEGIEHIRMNTLPDMWERTITIGSAGKAFSATGWRVGWAYGPQNLLRGLKLVHQQSIYTNSTLMQEAVAVGIEKQMDRIGDPEGFWSRQSDSLQKKRDFISEFLESLGVAATIPQGAYFIVCDLSNLASKLELQANEDEHHQLTQWLWTKKLRTSAGSVFYSESAKPLAKNFIRICFAKDKSNLQKAADILQGLKTSLSIC